MEWPPFRTLVSEKDLSIGAFGLFVLVAFVLGHLIQGVGSVIEPIIWFPSGLPTNWVRSTSQRLVTPEQRSALEAAVAKMEGSAQEPFQDRSEPVVGGYLPGLWAAQGCSSLRPGRLCQSLLWSKEGSFGRTVGLFGLVRGRTPSRLHWSSDSYCRAMRRRLAYAACRYPICQSVGPRVHRFALAQKVPCQPVCASQRRVSGTLEAVCFNAA
jgi:hypothetical protein